MFIQTESTGDANRLRVKPGRAVTGSGRVHFDDPADAAEASPLAARLLAVPGIVAVALGPDEIVVTRRAEADWSDLKPEVLRAVVAHYLEGGPALSAAVGAPEADEAAAQLRELIETRIRPTVAQAGGAVEFRGFEDGIVVLALEGRAAGLKGGIENMLRHYVPEVRAVREAEEHERLKSPAMNTSQALAVRQVLDQEVNPAVAGHGGNIALLDVKDDVAYIRLEGGCQGCGMADVTLKQGVEAAIRRAVPSIVAVRDTTDHAGGENPYFQPGKSGMTPF